MNKNKLTTLLIVFFLFSQFNHHEIFAEAKIKDPASDLLKKMEKAINAEQLKTVKGMSVKMTMSVPEANINGTSEMTVTANKVYNKVAFAGTEIEMGFDGKKAWSKDITQGIRELSGQEKESVIQTSLDVMKDPKAYFTAIETAPDEKFQDKDCFVLIFKKDGISDKKVFVDKTTFLTSGTSETQDTPQGKVTVKSIYHSYKKCENGYQMADSFTQDIGIMKMKITLSEIKFNPTIDEKIFNQPAN